MEKRSGIIGFTGTFSESLGDIKEGSKVVFTGSVAECALHLSNCSLTR